MLFMGKSTISMAIFNSYVSLPEGIRIRLPMLDIPTWGCIPLINGSEIKGPDNPTCYQLL